MSKPERNYAVCLIVLAILSLFVIGEYLVLIWRPISGDPALFLRALWLSVYIAAFFLAVLVCTLYIFVRRPAWAPLALTAANIVLMISIPIGTLLGVYYFRKVSKQLTSDSGEKV